MFETAELGRTVGAKAFDQAASPLRLELIELQQRLRAADFPVIVLFAGVDGAGKGGTVNLLSEWMDPRWIEVRAYGALSDEERERPPFWRYWRDLPPRGKVGMFLSAWYSRPLLERVHERMDQGEFDWRLERIRNFEKLLADDGALILKFWMHLGKKAQSMRLKTLEDDPLNSWRVTRADWRNYKLYKRFVTVAEHLIMCTSQPHAPWQIVEGLDPNYRSLAVATTLRDAIARHLELRAHPDRRGGPRGDCADEVAAVLEPARARTVLDVLDMSRGVPTKVYARRLPEAQARLNHLYRAARDLGRSMVLVFEGWDAAGKGGAIRRVTGAMDVRDVTVIPVAAPTDEERARNYLWRFWRHLGRAGRVTIYDRSWYGRVLVERVEGFAREVEWQRAYSEINDFERQLVDSGIVVVKTWLHITPDEQLARFESRQATPYKAWKLTDEDWRNRERRELYEQAVHEMVERTSTTLAPWNLVPANSKRFARLEVLRVVADALEGSLARDVTAGS